MKHRMRVTRPRAVIVGVVALLMLAGAAAAGVLTTRRADGDAHSSMANTDAVEFDLSGSDMSPLASTSPSVAPSASVSASVPPGGGPAAATSGYPVYTRAQIDAWSSGTAEYNRLAASWAGNVNKAYVPFGAEISSVERDVFRDQSVYIKVQAVLWAADGNAARRAKVIALLDELRPATSFQWDSKEQYRLVAGWSATNLAQAAAIVGYTDTAFRRFLVSVCYPILDWPGNPNWHASFADSKLAIAAYVSDTALWADAKAYFNKRIAQSIYHASYDGNKVRPLLNTSGAPSVGNTLNHWGGSLEAGYQQINSDFTPVNPAQFPNGTNAERTRDLGHVSMGLGGFMHGARTIVARGEALEPHARDRLRAAYAHHAQRVLAYINTGVIPAPGTARGDGGESYLMAWIGACTLFGSSTPSDVQTLCRHTKVTSRPAAGANHLVAEAFADRS